VGKLQHYVPQFYLRAWASRNKVYCLHDKAEIINTNVKNVGAENYFYRLTELSTEDAEILRGAIIRDSPEGLKPSHEWFVEAFNKPFLARRKLVELGRDMPEALSELDKMIVELNEQFHTSIEHDFQPYLAAMMAGKLDFLRDTKEAAKFYRGLAVQYLRTNHLKNSRLAMNDDKFALYLRIANPLVHITATNVGFSLYSGSERQEIMLVDNPTGTPFITADQPIINIASSPRATNPPAGFELYYPLSPTKAMLLLDISSKFHPGARSVTEDFVHVYNLNMAAHSYRQVFSNQPKVLEAIKTELPAFISCFPAENAR
jgi:hypothetical protein